MTKRFVSLWAFLTVMLAAPAFGAHGNYAEAMRVRALIRAPAGKAATAAETIKLPVSRGFNQEGTELCWSYATLNALEANYRAAHPGADLELSRRTMQYYTMKDRWIRKIQGTDDVITERGTAVDALNLIGANGLVAFDDFADVADDYGPDHVRRDVNAAGSTPAKLVALDGALAEHYGVPPETTHLDAGEMPREALREAVMEGHAWESYAVSRDGGEGYRTHPDPDARAGALSWFMPEAKLVARIHQALLGGFGVEITVGGHCLLIYGASYDASGKPMTYFIKDSYPDYFYESDPASLMANLVEMTTVKAL